MWLLFNLKIQIDLQKKNVTSKKLSNLYSFAATEQVFIALPAL